MTPREKLVTAEFGVSLEEAKRILHEHRIEKLPLLHKGKLKGLMTTQDIKKLEFWPNATRDEKGRWKKNQQKAQEKCCCRLCGAIQKIDCGIQGV